MKHNMRDSKGRFCKRPLTKGYKGFNKGLVCMDKQYKVGETYKEHGKKICQEGMMHFCENPLYVLEYYPAVDPDTGEPNEYAKVETTGRVIRDAKKSATNKLRIVKKISLKKLIKDAVATRRKSYPLTAGDFSDVATSENYSNAATTGRYANALTTGNGSQAATTGIESDVITVGNQAHAITAGYESDATTTGKFSCAATAGDKSYAASTGRNSNVATLGKYSTAATTGRYAHATTAGDYSRVTTVGRCSNAAALGERSYVSASGKHSIAAALGAKSRAKAALGNWLVLAEYDCEGKLLHVKAVKVDGKEIKPDTFYMLQYGKIIKD